MTAVRVSGYAPGRHRIRIVLPEPPSDAEKYIYIDRQLPYLVMIMAIGFSAGTASQIWFEIHTGWWPFALFTFTGIMSFGLSLPLSFTGRGFDIALHEARVGTWRPRRYPDVDIFLPICNEPIEILRNTWAGVFELVRAYPGAVSTYVLDDGADPTAQALAGAFGFTYVIRPGRGLHKKSGNLRYAFAHTTGKFIVILDADFVPRPDFLAETLPTLMTRISRSSRLRNSSVPTNARHGLSAPPEQYRRCSTAASSCLRPAGSLDLRRLLRGLPPPGPRRRRGHDSHPLRRGRAYRTGRPRNG